MSSCISPASSCSALGCIVCQSRSVCEYTTQAGKQGPVEICSMTEHLKTPICPEYSSSSSSSSSSSPPMLLFLEFLFVHTHPHTHLMEHTHWTTAVNPHAALPIIGPLSQLSFPSHWQQSDKSDEVFCQYIIFSCGKVPGKMIREEAEEERQEGMKEKSYKKRRVGCV